MKLLFSVSILGVLILQSCGTTNNVVSGGIIQKRKYNEGFYWKRNSNLNESSAKVEKGMEITAHEENSIAKSIEPSSVNSESASKTEYTIYKESNESVHDLVSVDKSDELKMKNPGLKTTKNLLKVKHLRTALSQESSISDSLNQLVPIYVTPVWQIIILVFVILAILFIIILGFNILLSTGDLKNILKGILLICLGLLLLLILIEVLYRRNN